MEKKGEIFSHSKLWVYESCPEYYKIKYVDKALPKLPISMSLFLGSVVHESLEWLYHQTKNREILVNELIENYSEIWDTNYSNEVKIYNGSPKEYFNKGVKFLVDYYMKNKPFKENTVGIEQKVLFSLDNEERYKIQGFIDRVVFNNGVYEVHDYKTNRIMKTQEELDSDRQLGLYHIGLKNVFGEGIKVRLYWHFLAFNQKLSSERTEQQLEKLKIETLELIEKIESDTEWAACGKKFCDWCEYKRKNNLNYREIVSLKNQELKFN
tara:strand:- start:1630 stop:2430 length:801 start_codon:yes stop_codon:yes gene_type:complete